MLEQGFIEMWSQAVFCVAKYLSYLLGTVEFTVFFWFETIVIIYWEQENSKYSGRI